QQFFFFLFRKWPNRPLICFESVLRVYTKVASEFDETLTGECAARFVSGVVAPDTQRHAIARVCQGQFTIWFPFALRLCSDRFYLHMYARRHRAILRRPANFSERHQIHPGKSTTGRKRATLYCPMFVTHLECTACGRQHAWSRLQNLCLSCSKPLFAIVDLAAAGRTLKRATVATREKSLWRYREVLPLPGGVDLVSLGEGG